MTQDRAAYREFLAAKQRSAVPAGRDAADADVSPVLHPWQRHVVMTTRISQLKEDRHMTQQATGVPDAPSRVQIAPGLEIRRNRLPDYCSCCGCVSRYCICSCCCGKSKAPK